MNVQAAVLSVADAMADHLGMLRRKLRAEDLLRVARRRAGVDDFGDMSFLDPLQLLLDACVEEASLSVVGRFALRWDTVRFLINLLRLRAAERRAPAIAHQPDRPADLHHRAAAQRHDVPAPADDGGSGKSRAAGLADDLPLSAGATAPTGGWRA